MCLNLLKPLYMRKGPFNRSRVDWCHYCAFTQIHRLQDHTLEWTSLSPVCRSHPTRLIKKKTNRSHTNRLSWPKKHWHNWCFRSKSMAEKSFIHVFAQTLKLCTCHGQFSFPHDWQASSPSPWRVRDGASLGRHVCMSAPTPSPPSSFFT